MSRILIVEDEVAIADLEKDYLELSGFEVEIENDGTNGLARALAEDFDLFILDLCCRELMDLKSVRKSGRKRTHLFSWYQQKRMTSTKSEDWDLGQMIISPSHSHQVSWLPE